MGTETRFATGMLCEAMCGSAVHLEGDRAVRIEGGKGDPLSRGRGRGRPVSPKAVAPEDVRLDPERVHEPCLG
jgi:hypothetical protein